MQPFNLVVHSYYSLLESILSIDDIINHSLNNNLSYAILTDYNLFGAMEFYQKAIKNNLKPIIGLDLSKNNFELVLIAKNYHGFQSLIKISSRLETHSTFNLNQYLNNDLFVIAKNDQYQNNTFKIWNKNDIYINEVKHNDENDFISFKVLEAIKNNITIENINNINKIKMFHWINTTNINEQQSNNFQKIIDEVNIVINPLSNQFPSYKKDINSKEYLFNLVIEGIKERLNINDNKIPKKYYDRAYHELEVINKLGYNDYFLIVSDFVNFAKKNEIIIGPGRGSAAGSLVSYCLNITELDPIKYNLIFERFLNEDRKTMPDIDIDVMDCRRDELINYIFNKYNILNTCQIITFQRIKQRMAIRDVGRVLNIPLPIIDNIIKNLPLFNEEPLVEFVKKNKNLLKFFNNYPELFKISDKLYNIPRQFSTHAAGIIIANEDISNIIPIQKGLNGFQLSQWSMEFLEYFGLNKIDILGLKNLSIIHDTINLVKKYRNKEINLQKINLEDQKIFQEIQKANTVGIFQLESSGMRSTLLKIKPKNLEDISIVSALFRPGPQMMINEYVKTRNNPKLIKYLHPDFIPILKPTNGFCIYQEQVIELIKVITNFSTSKADIIRRAISKKDLKLFNDLKEDFFVAAQNNHFTYEQTTTIYNMLMEFANYGFNHSHSLSYALISYQMMYLKYYYPLEFFIALLRNDVASSLKENKYINEAKKMGIKIYNLDIRYAQENFIMHHDGIMIGFNAIKGFGNEIIHKIIKLRNECDCDDYNLLIAYFYKNKVSLKNIEILIKIGAFDNYQIDRNFLLTNLNIIIKLNTAIDPLTKEPIFDANYIEYKAIDKITKENYENEYLGYAFTNAKYNELFKQYQKKYNLKNINEINHNEIYYSLIELKKIIRKTTKNQQEMLILKVLQNNIEYELYCFHENIFNELEKNKHYLIELKYNSIQNKNDIIKIKKID